MDYGLVLPETRSKSVPEFAETAENLGYESVWQGELWGESAFVELTAAAERTSNIRLGTAIVNVYSRSPAVLAMSAASLNRVSSNRFVLGVGVSTKKAIEDLHSQAYSRPIQRTKESVEVISQYLSDEGRVNYSGEIFDVQDFPSLDNPVPIYNAALGPKNRRVTGELCDGWLPNNVPISEMEASFDTIADAAEKAGRDPNEIEVAPWIHVAVADDPADAHDAVRGTVAYYVGASDGYKNAVGSAYPEEAEVVAQEWRAGNRDEARAAITEEMVLDLGCAGTIEDVQNQLASLRDHPVIDSVLVDIPAGLDETAVDETIEAASPENL